MEIRFIKKHEDAKLPKKNNKHHSTGDVGYDIFAVESIQIAPGDSVVVPVGLQLAFMTAGYWFRIEARSGLGFKKSLQPHFGVIDNPYRGDLGVKVYNLSDKVQSIEKGTACAQLIIYKMISAEIGWTDQIVPTARGDRGFGSSDLI